MKFQFGHIHGTKIGKLFKDRTALKNAVIYANTVKAYGA